MRQENCRNCDIIFKLNRPWQLFCCRKCRFKFNYQNNNCFYCGINVRKLTKNHILPCFYQEPKLVKVCKECHSIVGDKSFDNISNRFEYIYQSYVAKYHLEKGVVEWHDQELENSGKTLKEKIKHKLFIRRKMEDRAMYLKMRKEKFVI